ILVVAGPGAGKTFCLIGRVGHLIERLGVEPARICAVTFTNKAAEEIAQRLHKSLGARAEEVTRGTLHALCLGILREHGEAIGLRQGFGVADEEYQKIVLRRLRVPGKRASYVLQAFGRKRLKGAKLTAGDERLFQEYVAWLRQRSLLDFDDLVASTSRLLDERPDVARMVAARWDYVLVDEFQDLNAAQYGILKHLVEPHHNLFAVGDEEQSVFSWTGADPRILKQFQEEFGLPRPIILDRNHRCSRQIFETARRLLAENPTLFDKQLSAERVSDHDVAARAFENEDAEAAWMLFDLAADREATGRSWGDFAVLYRTHAVGDLLEGCFLRAGVPCRMARGRPLHEDPVIGYVIAALRLMRDPRDPAAAEALARKVLPETLLQEILRSTVAGPEDFMLAVRDLAGAKRGDPDGKKLWRLVFQVENLIALHQSHASLGSLVDDLLSQRLGPYRNVLEEHHDELTDPAEVPAAVALAGRLGDALRSKARVVIAPRGGLEIALRGMLFGAGYRILSHEGEAFPPALDDLRLGEVDALTLFKALQVVHARDAGDPFPGFVAFDLETTDKDAATCDIIEIAEVRVRDGEIADRFHSLVRPTRPITAQATRLAHGYTDDDVKEAPPFAEVWPKFREFAGGDTLVAHNAQTFDVPVLRRAAAGMEGVESLVFYDTLPLARSLSSDSAKLEDLAHRFGIDTGRSHRALDDSVTLARVFRELSRRKIVRARKSVLVKVLDWLAMALVLESPRGSTTEHGLLLEVARIHALGRFSDCLDIYAAELEKAAGAPPVAEVIERLGGRRLMEKLREDVDPARRYPQAVARLQTLLDASEADWLDEEIERFLERVALSTSEGADVDPHRVNLLTLHSTKGLEFSRVYVVGVENGQMPGHRTLDNDDQAEIQEARRLLYVGMTRARDRLVLTRVDRRFGTDAGGSRFLDEMEVVPVRAREPARLLDRLR
ncbi:MAG: UvrD-helicase domain-containing protein, partial [Gemmatimonadota bacterium]